jgi:FAD/FMN-containing dehydrogenase
MEGPVLAYGNGRSYGDVCLNSDGRLLDVRRLDKVLGFDYEAGIINCEAGMLLSSILELVIPHGWFVHVTPGTKFVTIGGAIANDVHGKSHHSSGSFGCHVRSFELVTSDGVTRRCSRDENRDLFFATVGGMGLTGLIISAEIQLKSVTGQSILEETIPFYSVREFYALSADAESRFEYTVAWIDCGSKGDKLGRGLLMCGDHSDEIVASSGPALTVPLAPPISLVRPITVRSFNEIFFRAGRRHTHPRAVSYEKFFYPLDHIHNWNRIYGRRGFLQFQSVVPMDVAEEFTETALDLIGRSKLGSFLSVLKVFGERQSGGMMSFPRKGSTLALDFPNTGPRVFELLDTLADLVVEAKGALYPAKDACMKPRHFEAIFPQWEEFRNFIDPGFSSDFIRRVTGADS